MHVCEYCDKHIRWNKGGGYFQIKRSPSGKWMQCPSQTIGDLDIHLCLCGEVLYAYEGHEGQAIFLGASPGMMDE